MSPGADGAELFVREVLGPSASSCGLERVIGMADLGVDRVSGFGLGVLVAPADVGADGGVLLGVGAVVGAVEREVAQGGELGFDPTQFSQELYVGRNTSSMSLARHQARTVVCLCGEKFVQDQMERLSWPAASQAFEEVEELDRAYAVPDPIVDLPGG